MKLFKLYIKSEFTLHHIAVMIRNVLNVNNTNTTNYQREQKRFGENYGGEYYLFEVIGLELFLLSNKGEALEEDFNDYEYYLMVKIKTTDDKVVFYLAEYLTLLFNSHNLKVYFPKEVM